jgi:hypothetical protein
MWLRAASQSANIYDTGVVFDGDNDMTTTLAAEHRLVPRETGRDVGGRE